MTENKRFGMVKTKDYDLYVPVDEMKFYIFPSFEDELDCIRVVNALNDLEEKSRVNGKLASQYLEENEQLKSENIDLRKDLGEFEKSINIQGLIGENEQLKHQNELLSDELEQCKAVIEKRWSEYLKKKELQE